MEGRCPRYRLVGGVYAGRCGGTAALENKADINGLIQGKILDPIADKLTQFTLTLCLSIKYPILRFVLVLFVIKESFQGIVGLIHLRKGKMLPGALMAGKICTTVLFLSLIALVLLPDIEPKIVEAIAIIDTAFLSFSFINYIFAYFGKHAKVQDLEQ